MLSRILYSSCIDRHRAGRGANYATTVLPGTNLIFAPTAGISVALVDLEELDLITMDKKLASNASGAGSLPVAMDLADTTNTVIVFDVSGWAELGLQTTTQGNKTWAFQTAPSPGYYINGRVKLKNADDTLLWHYGAAVGGPYNGTDGLLGDMIIPSL